MTVSPSAYWCPEAQFVNVPPSGFTTVKFILKTPPTRPDIKITDEAGNSRTEFDAGESLSITATGLRRVAAYDVIVSAGRQELFSSRLITNMMGEIEPTVLWPQLGMDDPNSEARFTYREARERWQGTALSAAIKFGKETVRKLEIRLVQTFSRPFVMASDREGRLLNGFEAGQEALFVSAHNLPFTGQMRIFMVPRHHDWNIGDEFVPADLADGRPAVRDIFLEEGQRDTTFEVAPAETLVPGAYDFVIRRIRYGYEEDEALRLLPGDLVSGRRTTGVVIREGFWRAKPVLGGCVNKIGVSGRTVSGPPYFQYADTFEVGENIYGALDPGIVDPNNIGKMCAFFVIQNKTETQWNTDNSLQHLAQLGGNPAVTKIKVQSGCVNANKVLLWPNAMDVGEYDIVADFGTPPTTDASAFSPDNAYNTPTDIIDGYFVAGFRVIEDPGTLTEYGNAGAWHYTEATVNGMGMVGTPTVEDELSDYGIPGGFSSINVSVPLRAHTYFPADMPGVTDPSQISTSKPDYPLIVIVHGNGHNYVNYDFLLEHFARNGFVAASIHLNGGMSGLGRANVFFKHMEVLQAKFGAKIQNNIGIMGHSRGGEAVLKVARLNQQTAVGHAINAIISLAPTDQYGKEVLAPPWAAPFFVLYGSRDGDVAGWQAPWLTPNYTVPQTGFSLWDRANGMQKSMAFVYKATHNGFITTNSDALAGDLAGILSEAVQQTITKAYINAFFRWRLRNEPKWEGMFKGEWKPRSVEQTSADIYVQYQDSTREDVDNFEGAHSAISWQSSTINGTVGHAGTLPADPSEDEIHDIDGLSPHDTGGLKLRWDNLTDKLEFSIPAANKDVSNFVAISFRVSQVAGSMENPANQSQNLRVALRDGSNNERAVRVSAFSAIPTPDPRAMANLTKSAMNTVRIPLKSYSIVCAGQPQVNLKDVVMLTFSFSEQTKGEIDIDNIEFTN
jgi:hypothetical protein